MWPTLISIGPLAIHSFGVLLFLGLFLGGFTLWGRGREEGFDEEMLMDGWLLSALVALITGRIAYVLTHWESFAGNLYQMAFISKFPGLSFEGALVGVLLSLGLFASKKRWALWKFLDVSVFAIMTVMIWGSLGSFLAGSNLGIAVEGWWSLPFPGIEGRHLPLQLIWVVVFWLILRLLYRLEHKYRTFTWYQHDKDEAKPGFLTGSFLILLGLSRFGLNWLKLDRFFKGPLGLEQWWGLALTLIGVLLILIRSGITIKASAKAASNKLEIKSGKKRKKIGFDFK